MSANAQNESLRGREGRGIREAQLLTNSSNLVFFVLFRLFFFKQKNIYFFPSLSLFVFFSKLITFLSHLVSLCINSVFLPHIFLNQSTHQSPNPTCILLSTLHRFIPTPTLPHTYIHYTSIIDALSHSPPPTLHFVSRREHPLTHTYTHTPLHSLAFSLGWGGGGG